jgi:hypothetical protein
MSDEFPRDLGELDARISADVLAAARQGVRDASATRWPASATRSRRPRATSRSGPRSRSSARSNTARI